MELLKEIIGFIFEATIKSAPLIIALFVLFMQNRLSLELNQPKVSVEIKYIPDINHKNKISLFLEVKNEGGSIIKDLRLDNTKPFYYPISEKIFIHSTYVNSKHSIHPGQKILIPWMSITKNIYKDFLSYEDGSLTNINSLDNVTLTYTLSFLFRNDMRKIDNDIHLSQIILESKIKTNGQLDSLDKTETKEIINSIILKGDFKTHNYVKGNIIQEKTVYNLIFMRNKETYGFFDKINFNNIYKVTSTRYPSKLLFWGNSSEKDFDFLKEIVFDRSKIIKNKNTLNYFKISSIYIELKNNDILSVSLENGQIRSLSNHNLTPKNYRYLMSYSENLIKIIPKSKNEDISRRSFLRSVKSFSNNTKNFP